MNLLDILKVTGEPGTIGVLLVLAWRVRRLELSHDSKLARLLNLEAKVHTQDRKLDNLTRLRERRDNA